eukprot:m.9073 g.9073  ORF g.9073 m.9073 type:complete len:57 (+) comp3398_c0_seq1:109-279(+)
MARQLKAKERKETAKEKRKRLADTQAAYEQFSKYGIPALVCIAIAIVVVIVYGTRS